jgi:hypothetical protein
MILLREDHLVIIRSSLSLAIVVCGVTLAARASCTGVPSPNFTPGRSIKSPVPTTAKVVIGRIEAWKDKVAVHVSVIDIPSPPETSLHRGLISIDHVPFDKSALMASVDQLLATGVSVQRALGCPVSPLPRRITNPSGTGGGIAGNAVFRKCRELCLC